MNSVLIVELAQFIGVLTTLIIVHELGHFIVCRLLKVEVEEFGLGFPPRLLTLFEAGKTRFTLNLILLGGFVRPKGENDPSIPGGLAAARPWVRLAVLGAGPLANLLVGVLLYAVIFTRVGIPVTNQVMVIEVAQGSPAEQAGLLPGDMLLAVNEIQIHSIQDLQEAIFNNLEQPTRLTYQRQGQDYQVSLTPRRNPPAGEGAIGITMANPTRPVNLLQAVPIGTVAVYQHSRELLAFPVRLATGRSSPDEGRLVGFKGMFDIFQEVRQSEPLQKLPAGVSTMSFFATITISLGLLNMLPIPALDGGRILFTIPEIAIRRRIPPQYENVINLVSFALLLLLLIYINIQDFLNPIQLP